MNDYLRNGVSGTALNFATYYAKTQTFQAKLWANYLLISITDSVASHCLGEVGHTEEETAVDSKSLVSSGQ